MLQEHKKTPITGFSLHWRHQTAVTLWSMLPLMFLPYVCWVWSPSCIGICPGDIVIMYSNRGTFCALCWLLIGLKCNNCVILMTQIHLIVIFMRYEDCLVSLRLDGAALYEDVCEQQIWFVAVDAKEEMWRTEADCCVSIPEKQTLHWLLKRKKKRFFTLVMF